MIDDQLRMINNLVLGIKVDGLISEQIGQYPFS